MQELVCRTPSERSRATTNRNNIGTQNVGGVGGGPEKMFDKHQIVCEVFSRLSKDSIFCCQIGWSGSVTSFLCPTILMMATIPLLGVIYKVDLVLRIIHWRSRSQQEEESLCTGVRNDFLHQELWMKKWSTQAASKRYHSNSPGNPVVKTPYFHCRGHRFDPWLEN